MDGIIRDTNRAGEPIGPGRHRGITRTDQRQICALVCFCQMCANGLDCEGTGNFTGIAAAHTVTDDIESERRVGHKAVLVMGPLKACMGFGTMQLFESQTTPPSGRKTLQAGTELARELIRATITVKQLFL